MKRSRAIKKLHGILLRKAKRKSFAVEWAEYKREERRLERGRLDRNA